MDQFEYMVTTYSSDTCKRLGVEGVDLYGGTRHSSARALLKKYSPDEIKRYGTLHRTSKAFERYLGDVEMSRILEMADTALTPFQGGVREAKLLIL